MEILPLFLSWQSPETTFSIQHNYLCNIVVILFNCKFWTLFVKLKVSSIPVLYQRHMILNSHLLGLYFIVGFHVVRSAHRHLSSVV